LDRPPTSENSDSFASDIMQVCVGG
jgi:hypothetical protein